MTVNAPEIDFNEFISNTQEKMTTFYFNLSKIPTCKTTMVHTNPRHLGTWTFRYGLGQVGTELDISVLGTGQFGTWMRQFGTDHNCLVLIVNIFVLVVL